MHYPDSKDRSAELLRLAIPKMASHPAPLHPITYAVWYDYLAGRNPALQAEVDSAVSHHVPLSDDLVQTLYLRHVAEAAEQTTRKVSAGLRDVLQDVEATTTQTGALVSGFQDSLAERSSELDAMGSAEQVDATIRSLLSGTRDAGAGLAQLAQRLNAATLELEQLRRELDEVRAQATLDALTGVTNRRGFDDAMRQMLHEHPADTPGPSAVLIDLDNFKQINDRYGHVFGDTVLKSVAQAIRSCVKGRDLVARYGGEEFVVLLPATALGGAVALAEQIRATIAGARIRRGAQHEAVGTITVSLGVSSWQRGEHMEQLIERADRALYRSKRDGRNRVSADH